MRTHPLVEALQGLGGPPARPGVVHLVGGGPGDPGHLTARACVLLATCDVVLHDRLSPPEALALAPADAERIVVGKRHDEQGMSRAQVDALMAGRAADGKAVVRLKGGDPFVFGRGAEEATALRLAGVPFEIVSGVTSAIAVPAAAGIPVTHRGLAAGFAVVTGHEDPAKGGGHVDFATLARFPGTLLFLMGAGHIEQIAELLQRHGRDADEPVAMVRWGTTPHQRVLRGTLATIAECAAASNFGAPAVTVVGAVAGLGDELAWRHELPLFGRSVLVPRARTQASTLAMHVRALGGEPLEAPTIEIRPGDLAALDDELRAVASVGVGAVAVTSPNGVDALADGLERVGLDARVLARAGIVACVGPGTAARLWDRLRVRADLVPATSTSEGLAAAFPAAPDAPATAEGRRAATALLPRADIATTMLADGLRAKGWSLVEVDAYVTGQPADLPADAVARLAEGSVDLVAFASSSTVRNFLAMVSDRPWSGRVVSIGPVTSATCRDLGVEVHTEADPHDLDGLVAALVRAAADLPPLAG